MDGEARTPALSPTADGTGAALVAAIEDNLFELFRAFGSLPGGEVAEGPAMLRHWTGLASPMFNGVSRSRLGADPSEAVKETIAWFRERERAFFWWTGPQTEPEGLDEALEGAGLQPGGREWPGMALALGGVSEYPAAAGLTIDRVGDSGELGVWARTFCSAFGIPDWAGESWVAATESVGPAAAPWRLYVARLDGRPAGVSISFVAAGVVGLYGIGIVPEARRRGVGAALTVRPMLDARAEGAGHAILHSTEEGYPLYRRLGFEELCTVSRFVWLR